MAREREYAWYRAGCERLGAIPLDPDAFAARWQEFEDHAEKLKAAEAAGKTLELEAAARAEMQQRVKVDPFVQAILVGMAEDPSAMSEIGDAFAPD